MRYFYFVLAISSALFAENLDTPSFSIEADAVGVVFPARMDLALLYNANNNYVAARSRSLNPYWTGTVRGVVKISSNDYETMNIWFLGPIHLLYRSQLERVTNDFREYTTPYETTNWEEFYYYRYKNTSIIYQGGVLYEYHFTPEYQDYFSATVKGGVRAIYFKDDYDSTSIAGGNVNQMNIGMRNNILGPEFGFRFMGRPTTQFSWNVDLSGGVYANLAKKHIYLEDLGGEVVVDTSFRRVKLAGSIDADLCFRYRVDHFSLNLTGFYGKFISMASAVAQLGQSKNLNKISNTESIPYTGLRAGVEFFW